MNEVKGGRILCFVQYRFSMHLKEEKKLGRFPFSELKSVHNCAQDNFKYITFPEDEV